MGIELGKAWVRIRGDSSKLPGDLNKVKGSVKSTVKSIANSIPRDIFPAWNVSGISENFKQVEQVVQSSTQGMSLSIQSMIAPIMGVTASMGTMIKVLMSAGKFEQTTIAFETMIGSVEETKKTLAELTEFAALTPFEMPEIESAARGLIMFGERGDDLMDTLNLLGNAASGTSTPFGFLALVFNQIRGVGKLLTQDFRQLSTRGILSLQDIADHFDVTTAAAQRMLSAGKISFEDVKSIFRGLSAEGGRFANLMERQSRSMLGLWSTLKDAMGITARTLGQTLLPAAKGVVTVFIAGVEAARAFTMAHSELVKNVFIATTALIALKSAWIGLGIAAAAAGKSMWGAFIAVTIAAGKFAIIIAAISAALWTVQKIWSFISEETSDAEKELSAYNDAMDELIEKREKLARLLEEEKEGGKEERVNLAIQTKLVNKLNEARDRRRKAEVKEEELRRETEESLPGAGKKPDRSSSIIQQQQAANEYEITRLKELIETDKEILESRGRSAQAGGPIDWLYLKGVEARLEGAKKSLKLAEARREVTKQQVEQEVKLAEVIEERNEARKKEQERGQKALEKFAEGMAKIVSKLDQRNRKMRSFVDALITPQQKFDEFAEKLKVVAKEGLFKGDVKAKLAERWALTPMGKAAEKTKKEAQETSKAITRMAADLLVAAGAMSKVDLQMKRFKEGHLTTPEQDKQMRTIFELQDEKAKEKEGIFGRMGFAEYANRIQDAVLKKDDPQKQLVRLTKEQKTILQAIAVNTKVPKPAILGAP